MCFESKPPKWLISLLLNVTFWARREVSCLAMFQGRSMGVSFSGGYPFFPFRFKRETKRTNPISGLKKGTQMSWAVF